MVIQQKCRLSGRNRQEENACELHAGTPEACGTSARPRKRKFLLTILLYRYCKQNKKSLTLGTLLKNRESLDNVGVDDILRL